VQISEAKTLAPCTNTPLIDTPLTLAANTSVSAVAAVNTGKPGVLVFTDNLEAIAAGDARFVLANAADAAELQATLTQVGVTKPKSYTVTADPAKETAINVPAGAYTVQVVLSGGTTVLASQTINLPLQSTTFSYAAGEATNGSLGLVNKTVQGVF
jgi:hypothetical protein